MPASSATASEREPSATSRPSAATALEALAALGGRAADLLDRDHGGGAAAAGTVVLRVGREIVGDDHRLDRDPVVDRVIAREAEVDDVAGVVLDDVHDAAAAARPRRWRRAICTIDGLAKIPPGTAASSIPRPTKPVCSGSWPEPPPEITATRGRPSSSARMTKLGSRFQRSDSGIRALETLERLRDDGSRVVEELAPRRHGKVSYQKRIRSAPLERPPPHHDHRRSRQLPQPRRAARVGPGRAVLLPQAGLLARPPAATPVVRPRGHRAAHRRGRDRRRSSAVARATSTRRRAPRTSAGSRRRTTSGSMTCAGPTAARTSSPRARTASLRSASRRRPTRLDLGALTLRTRVNGSVVQEDSTANLIFTFGLLVADLSRFVTLEPGDVILTGTPAGAAVVVPGDRVEVEIDGVGTVVNEVRRGARADRPGSARSRRSAARRAPRPSASTGSARSSSRTPRWRRCARSRRRRSRCTWPAAGSATRSSPACARRGPTCGCSATPIRCATCRCARTFATPSHAELNAQKRAIESIGPGEVLVIDARGETGAGTIGDILAARAMVRGASGIVTDGGVRDLAAVSRAGHPDLLQGGAPRGARPAALPARGQRPGRLRRRARDAGRRDRRRRGRRARAARGARRAGRARRAGAGVARDVGARARAGRRVGARHLPALGGTARGVRGVGRGTTRADELVRRQPRRDPRRDHPADHAVHADGELDLDTIARLVDWQLAAGSHGISVGGSTGEPVSQTRRRADRGDARRRGGDRRPRPVPARHRHASAWTRRSS